ncbi:MAG: HAMP domain-containing histidine kinase, partial [Pseudomonadota bacterium]|nr:HAMP domain-containing histidine kinase [Pseudomonadota bacterium]
SDLPVLLLTRGGSDSLEVGDALALLRNVTLLERPLRVAALVTTVHTALRARNRQYEIESQLQELEAARDLQVQALKQKDEFLAMLAHELRNPLAPIRNALHVLESDDSDPDRRQHLRGMMQRQVDHMVRLVDDLLEASRLSRGMITLHRKHGDLCDAVRSAIEIASPAMEAGCLTLAVDWPDTPMPVDIDSVRIAQVFGNLLNNAAKFGCEGGHVSLVMRREGRHAVVEVNDDGAGISPELLPRVFDLFAQGPGHTSSGMTEGLGIGLALVQSLVALHGGTVQAASDGESRGARFTVRLPLAEAIGAAAGDTGTGTQPESIKDPQNLRVLAVDDNVDAAHTLAWCLNAWVCNPA